MILNEIDFYKTLVQKREITKFQPAREIQHFVPYNIVSLNIATQ